MRHKQVLDVAEKNPNASVEELASRVPSATTELVEHVLEEYGDPATSTELEAEPNSTEETSTDGDVRSDEETATTSETTAGSESEKERSADDEYPDPETLSEKQREVLAVIAANPEATQQEIGERLGVSASAVSNRVNSIEGFEWSDRTSFVETVYDESPSVETTADGGAVDEAVPSETAETATHDTIADIETALGRLEARIADLEASLREEAGETAALTDPELVHKVVHACMESDTISEAEELRILRSLLG
jgi:DNA-binding MarR family transcriptional regulator